MYELSVCADTVYEDLTFALHIGRNVDAGFAGEFWGCEQSDLACIPTENIQALIGIYHSQVDERNVSDAAREYHASIRQFHVANVPPGTGELNYELSGSYFTSNVSLQNYGY